MSDPSLNVLTLNTNIDQGGGGVSQTVPTNQLNFDDNICDEDGNSFEKSSEELPIVTGNSLCEDAVEELNQSFQTNFNVDTTTECRKLSNSWKWKHIFDENNVDCEPVDVFIMSEAGKPIFCYSEREDVITLMGVCVALVNYVFNTQNDHLKSINTLNGLHINFSVRPPLIIVVISRRHSCFDDQTLINQIHAQIVSTITLKSLKTVFQKVPTYDLKRVIHTNEFKTMSNLVKSITTPIADQFSVFQTQHVKPNVSLFNNVISFYTSSFTAPRTTTVNPVLNNGVNFSNNSLVVVQDHKPNVLSRVFIPIAIVPSGFRDQLTSLINSAVSSYTDIVFSILFQIEEDGEDQFHDDQIISLPQLNHSNTISSSEEEFIDALDDVSSNNSFIVDNTGNSNSNIHADSGFVENNRVKTEKCFKLVAVCNHTVKFRINPLDVQLIYSFIKASDGQLSTTEFLWLPLCLSRIDVNRFLYAHISYLSKKYCLVLLDVERSDFDKCRIVKETIQSKLQQLKLPDSENILRSSISEIGQPQLQYICYQTLRNCIMWQASTQIEYSNLNYYLIERMQRSSLKTLWIRSEKHQCALLGWHTASFQLYAQFDITVTQRTALNTVKTFIAWLKKEEDKLVFKDN